MAKLENSLKNMVLSLTVITLVVGALLGWVASVTEAPIAEAAAKAQAEAIKAVVPVEGATADAGVEVADCGNGLPSTVFTVSKDGQVVGRAVQVTTKKGFGGKCIVMVGFDAEGTILGYNVLDCSNETPGLGAKMPNYFQTEENGGKGGKSVVIGLNPTKNNITVSKDGGDVDAITAATISSRAFCDAVALAWASISGNTDAVTAATGQVAEPAAEEQCCGDCNDAEGCQKPDSLKCDKCKAKAEAEAAAQ